MDLNQIRSLYETKAKRYSTGQYDPGYTKITENDFNQIFGSPVDEVLVNAFLQEIAKLKENALNCPDKAELITDLGSIASHVINDHSKLQQMAQRMRSKDDYVSISDVYYEMIRQNVAKPVPGSTPKINASFLYFWSSNY